MTDTAHEYARLPRCTGSSQYEHEPTPKQRHVLRVIAERRKGLLSRGSMRARTLHITDAGKRALGMDPRACIHCGCVPEGER